MPTMSVLYGPFRDDYVTQMESNQVGCTSYGSLFCFNHSYFHPVCSFPLRRDVESCNNTKLEALPGDPCTFSAMDFAGYDYEGNPIDKSSAERLLDRINASPVISLKVNSIFLNSLFIDSLLFRLVLK